MKTVLRVISKNGSEYIDISKEYSTPNSKTFINGVLDKIIADLKRDNKIQKTGRGLMEGK